MFCPYAKNNKKEDPFVKKGKFIVCILYMVRGSRAKKPLYVQVQPLYTGYILRYAEKIHSLCRCNAAFRVKTVENIVTPRSGVARVVRGGGATGGR